MNTTPSPSFDQLLNEYETSIVDSVGDPCSEARTTARAALTECFDQACESDAVPLDRRQFIVETAQRVLPFAMMIIREHTFTTDETYNQNSPLMPEGAEVDAATIAVHHAEALAFILQKRGHLG